MLSEDESSKEVEIGGWERAPGGLVEPPFPFLLPFFPSNRNGSESGYGYDVLTTNISASRTTRRIRSARSAQYRERDVKRRSASTGWRNADA